MERGRFIMVTRLDNHWDKIPNSKTYYKKDLISKDLLKKLNDPNFMYEKITTYFVKINESQIEHIYKGHISDIRKKDDYIYFKVNLEEEIKKDEYDSCLFPVFRPGKLPRVGWYYQEYDSVLPSFLEVLKETEDPYTFEDLTYYLLKLIGINDIIKYESTEQAGLPDGIFKIGNLVVIYDATLNEQLNQKWQQISNYVNKIKYDKVEVSISESKKVVWDIKNFSKRVWIITRYKEFEEQQIDDVKVKVVTIDALFEIYEERLKGKIGDEETLKKRLENL